MGKQLERRPASGRRSCARTVRWRARGIPSEVGADSRSIRPGAIHARRTTVALNRRARHEFTIDETFEAGLVLTGTEIKSIRAGKANIANAYARIERGEAWLIGADIAPFEQAATATTTSRSGRASCSSTARQIDELLGRAEGQGPDDRAAPAVHHAAARPRSSSGLARGKQLHDKRRDIAERDSKRDIARQLADVQRGR